MSRDYRLFLDDILTSSEKIVRYTRGLNKDNLTQRRRDRREKILLDLKEIKGFARPRRPFLLRFSFHRRGRGERREKIFCSKKGKR